MVRHGQSKWNEAQHNRDYAKLMAFDHPLTLEGSQQATELREKWETARLEVVGATPPLIDLGEEGNRPPLDRWLKAFLSARVVLSSPLTRAVQTAVLALHKHPALDAKGLRLLRSAREVKGSMGSLDSIGKAVGSEIIVRVREKLGELMDEASVSRVMEVRGDAALIALIYVSVFFARLFRRSSLSLALSLSLSLPRSLSFSLSRALSLYLGKFYRIPRQKNRVQGVYKGGVKP